MKGIKRLFLAVNSAKITGKIRSKMEFFNRKVAGKEWVEDVLFSTGRV